MYSMCICAIKVSYEYFLISRAKAVDRYFTDGSIAVEKKDVSSLITAYTETVADQRMGCTQRHIGWLDNNRTMFS